MPRKDRRSRAPRVFGKPDVAYPQASVDHKQVIESFTVRQSNLPKPFLSEHPDHPNAKLISQDGDPGDNTDVSITLEYETLPGVEIPTVGYDPVFNNPTTLYTQRNEAGTDLPVLGDDKDGQVITDASLPLSSAVVGSLRTSTEDLPSIHTIEYTQASGGNLKKLTRRRIRTNTATEIAAGASKTLPAAAGANTILQKIVPVSTVVGIEIIEQWVDSTGADLTVSPWQKSRATIEPEGVEEITWVKVVSASVLPPELGATSITVGAEVTSLATTARVRIPKFPTGITGAGTWDTAEQGYVIHSELRDIEDSPNRILIVKTCGRPRARYEFPEVTHQFPALLRYDTSTPSVFWIIVNGKLPLRTDGSMTYISHRTRRVVGVLMYRYSIGPAATLSNQFNLTSPGAGSVYFGQLDANTIYGNVAVGETTVKVYNADGLIEQFPFSSLSGCAPAANSVAGTDDTIATAALPIFYRLSASQKPWMDSNIFVREYLIIAEDRNLVSDAQELRFSGTTENATTGIATATNTQYLYCS